MKRGCSCCISQNHDMPCHGDMICRRKLSCIGMKQEDVESRAQAAQRQVSNRDGRRMVVWGGKGCCGSSSTDLSLLLQCSGAAGCALSHLRYRLFVLYDAHSP
jgi:hypothetical protein